MNIDTLERLLYRELRIKRNEDSLFCFDDFVCLVTPTALYYTYTYIHTYIRKKHSNGRIECPYKDTIYVVTIPFYTYESLLEFYWVRRT